MIIDRFIEISRIPRGSGFNTRISDYLVDFARRHYLNYVQDDSENVVIYRRASIGYENCPPLIIQGHMDMVCESRPGVEHDFTEEGLKIVDDGRFMWAEGTTLGADDGVALAYMLELLADHTIARPPLEMVFTTDEEIGMDGAQALDASLLKGRHLINIDSEEEGIFIAGCAGGLMTHTFIPIERERKQGKHAVITIKGLKGGHSGTDIDKNRINADILMGRLLFDKNLRELFGLISIVGGTKDNVIPSYCTAEIIIDKYNYDEFIAALSSRIDKLEHELKEAEPELEFECTHYESSDSTAEVLTDESFEELIRYLNLVPNGVRTVRMVKHGGEENAKDGSVSTMVESSLNLGILSLEAKDDDVTLVSQLRSSRKSYVEYMDSILADLAEQCGAEYEVSGSYPGYKMKNSSEFRDMLCDAYESVAGKKPVVASIHAGLEIGVFAKKIPGIDIISLGPDVYNIHTVNEKLDLESFERMWEFLKLAVSTFAEKYK